MKRLAAIAVLELLGCAPAPVTTAAPAPITASPSPPSLPPASASPPAPAAEPAPSPPTASLPAEPAPSAPAEPAPSPLAEVAPAPAAPVPCPAARRRSWSYGEGERLFSQVQKGWSRARVLGLLGAPRSCVGADWVYVAGPYEGPEVTFVFTFAKGVVAQIDSHRVGCRMVQ